MNASLGEGLVLARRAGQSLYLAGGLKKPLSFERLGPRTIFFSQDEFEKEIKRLGVEESLIVPEAVHVEVSRRAA